MPRLMTGLTSWLWAGGCHAHNVSASLMQTVGSPAAGWVATDVKEYVDTAVKAAGDLHKLAVMREQLRPAMLASPLCAGRHFVNLLEDAYSSMWQQQWQSWQSQDAAELASSDGRKL